MTAKKSIGKKRNSKGGSARHQLKISLIGKVTKRDIDGGSGRARPLGKKLVRHHSK